MTQCDLSTRKWMNYQRALALLNEAVGILKSPGTSAKTSGRLQSQVTRQAVVTFTAQDFGTTGKRGNGVAVPVLQTGCNYWHENQFLRTP